jgi:hypothetical protein
VKSPAVHSDAIQARASEIGANVSEFDAAKTDIEGIEVLLTEAETAQLAVALTEAKANLDRAREEIKRAEAAEQRACERAEAARRLRTRQARRGNLEIFDEC